MIDIIFSAMLPLDDIDYWKNEMPCQGKCDARDDTICTTAIQRLTKLGLRLQRLFHRYASDKSISTSLSAQCCVGRDCK